MDRSIGSVGQQWNAIYLLNERTHIYEANRAIISIIDNSHLSKLILIHTYTHTHTDTDRHIHRNTHTHTHTDTPHTLTDRHGRIRTHK